MSDLNHVMQSAQALAEAILESEIYQGMKAAENRYMRDEEAISLTAAVSEKRNQVQELLTANDMDHAALALAGEELEKAEEAMNACAAVHELQDARKAFTTMMDNVNRILRLVITGETGDDEAGSGCSGNCSGCAGCH